MNVSIFEHRYKNKLLVIPQAVMSFVLKTNVHNNEVTAYLHVSERGFSAATAYVRILPPVVPRKATTPSSSLCTLF